jgi:hypothetical protein
MQKRHAMSLTLVAVVHFGCGGEPSGTPVEAAGFGARWPLTVARGAVWCDRGAAIFTDPEGRPFALNGVALQRGVPDIDTIQRLDAALNAEIQRQAPDGPPARVRISTAPLLEIALRQCP